MANKLIIDNRTDLTDFEVLKLVIVIVENGINKQVVENVQNYCASIKYGGVMYDISNCANKISETFVISKNF